MSTYRLQHLTGTRLKTFLAVANRIIPIDDDSPGGGTMLTAGVVDWALDKMPEKLSGKFMLFITVVGIFGYFFGGRSFSKCSPETQDRILKWLENNPLSLFRMGFFGVRTYVCMGYYSREDIWKTFDYDGPVVKERTYIDSAIREMCEAKVEVVE